MVLWSTENILVKSSNRPRVFLPIFGKVIRTISISFAFPNRPAFQSSITENGLAKLLKLYPGGFAEYTYPQFQNSQKFELDDGVIFDILANSNEFHADGVFSSALYCSICVWLLK